ncbi:hypothetical protein GCWU000324_01645 [Kingella oralis ATCC 51147]|jgi:hypothetical protein|uniref:Uncharacterized protein n=1 Tax=Kingella oralis ATCC 51147 TaxID=629741 RepID=C4GKY9_9NEIS|nr:hypothetical protein GCWU000324_01645 [Kingella oralis ATCC 51147]
MNPPSAIWQSENENARRKFVFHIFRNLANIRNLRMFKFDVRQFL